MDLPAPIVRGGHAQPRRRAVWLQRPAVRGELDLSRRQHIAPAVRQLGGDASLSGSRHGGGRRRQPDLRRGPSHDRQRGGLLARIARETDADGGGAAGLFRRPIGQLENARALLHDRTQLPPIRLGRLTVRRDGEDLDPHRRCVGPTRPIRERHQLEPRKGGRAQIDGGLVHVAERIPDSDARGVLPRRHLHGNPRVPGAVGAHRPEHRVADGQLHAGSWFRVHGQLLAGDQREGEPGPVVGAVRVESGEEQDDPRVTLARAKKRGVEPIGRLAPNVDDAARAAPQLEAGIGGRPRREDLQLHAVPLAQHEARRLGVKRQRDREEHGGNHRLSVRHATRVGAMAPCKILIGGVRGGLLSAPAHRSTCGPRRAKRAFSRPRSAT